MRAELLSAVVQPSNAAVFAHLSPEESPAAWHLGRSADEATVASGARGAAALSAASRRRFVASSARYSSSWWPTPSCRASLGRRAARLRARAVCPLLWWRCCSTPSRGARRRRRAASRMCCACGRHPPGCALRPPSVAQLLEPGLDAVALSDQLVLLRRSAVRVALRAYVAAPASPHCRLAPELCVDALLLLANFSLARAGREAPRSCAASRCVNRCSAEASSAGRAPPQPPGARLRRHPVLCGRAALDTGAPRAVPECSRSLFSPRRAQIGDETAEICARTPMRCSVLCDAWRRLEACRCPGFGREPVKVSSVNASALARLC